MVPHAEDVHLNEVGFYWDLKREAGSAVVLLTLLTQTNRISLFSGG